MEKIKEALAKAKQQQVRTQSTVVAAGQKAPPEQTAFRNTENELDKINYQNTAVVKLDARHLERHRIVSHIKNNAITGIFDSLRTQVLQKMEENNWRTLAVVSPTPESGKTMVSINLAISIAHQPQRTVMLVDFDLRRPRVASYLGLHSERSSSDYLSGKAGLKEVLVNPGIPRLVVLPTMRPISKSAELLSSSRVSTLIKELRERYSSRIVIFDLPPVLSSDDAMVLLPQVDCVLLVVANGMSTHNQIEQTMHLIPSENLLGVVYNKGDIEPASYYY